MSRTPATAEMLSQGRDETREAGIGNVAFARGLAENLPYPDETFEMVLCRLGVHHFQEPHVQLREMRRVCRPAGSVGIIDLVSPPEKDLVERYNHLERLRDPTHTRALSRDVLVELVRDADLAVSHVDARDVEVNVERWLALTHADEASGAEIKDALRHEMAGATATGMRPFAKNGELMFLQTWAIVVGRKLLG